jgi:hypothetical protein
LRHLRHLTAGILLALAFAAAATAQPRGSDHRVAIFFYPWYGTQAVDGGWWHWGQNGHVPPNDIASNYYPASGLYSSADPTVLDRQMQEIADAGITDVITSWWGRGSLEDRRLPLVLAAARKHGLAVAVHLEPYGGRTLDSIAQDIAYLRTLGISDVYVYAPSAFSADDWAALNSQLSGVRLFAQTTLVGWAAKAKFAGIYSYDVLGTAASIFGRLCAQARAAGILCAPSVGPGFDASQATGDTRYKSRANGGTYDSMWSAAIAAGADLVTITSFNEWHEGTQIEPAGPAPSNGGLGYSTYDGAYGLTGAAAADAYLTRTLYWTNRYRFGQQLAVHKSAPKVLLQRR